MGRTLPPVKAPRLKAAANEDRLARRIVEAILGRIGPTSNRAVVLIGAKPAHALTRAYPEFNAALLFLDLRAQIARAFPAADAEQLAFRAAREDVEKALAAMTDEHYAGAAKVLRELVGDTPAAKSKRSLLDAVRKQLDADYPATKMATAARPNLEFKPKLGKFETAVAPAVVRAAPKTAFEVLEDLAAESGEVAHALRTFQQACLHEDESVIRQTATALQDAISKNRKAAADLSWKAGDRCRRAIETVARSFERQLTSASGLDARLAFWQAFDRLKATHPMVSVYARLQSWLTPDDLEKFGTAVARMKPLSGAGMSKEALAEAADGRIGTLLGKLGEIVGVKGAYRRTFEAELRRASEFADSPAGKGWRVHVARTPVRALRADGKGFHQFYDDAILLVDEARNKIAPSFTGQFKAGDAASLGILAQLDSDEVREGLGKLLVDGKAYDIEKGVIARRSVIVTTKLAVGEEQTFTKGGAAAAKRAATKATTDPTKIAAAIADREIQFLPMGPNPTDLRSFVRFFLAAAGKIPST